MALRNPAIRQKETELVEVRSKHFRARTPRTKEKWRAEDKRLRALLNNLKLPTYFGLETKAVANALGKDKKREGNWIHFVLLNGIGSATVAKITLTELEDAIHG